jgi:hypothetical protein
VEKTVASAADLALGTKIGDERIPKMCSSPICICSASPGGFGPVPQK